MSRKEEQLNKYERTLLEGWEEVYKKSQLTLWILLALKEGEKHSATIEHFITETTNGTIQADQQSLYRALRRLKDADLINYKQQASAKGPDIKVYRLTPIGESLLKVFLQRNVINVFYKTSVKALINK